MPRLPISCKRWVLGLLGVLLASGGGARVLSAQFAIDELELHFQPSGNAVTRLIPIRSVSDTAQQISITVADWFRDSIGGNRMAEFGSLPSSCGSRLEVFPRSLQLGPRATEFVRVTLSPGESPDPGCWSIVLAEAVKPPPPPTERATVSITTVMGVKVYAHAAQARAAGEVISADVETFLRPVPPRDSVLTRQIAVRFASTGTAHLRVKSSAELRDESARLVASLTGPEAYITPDGFRDILLRLPDLPAGRYVAVVTLDFGGPELLAAQVEFEVR